MTASIVCRNFLCHPPGYEDLDLAGPTDMPWHHASFDVDGGLANGSATATLVELDPATGMASGSGRVTVTITF